MQLHQVFGGIIGFWDGVIPNHKVQIFIMQNLKKVLNGTALPVSGVDSR